MRRRCIVCRRGSGTRRAHVPAAAAPQRAAVLRSVVALAQVLDYRKLFDVSKNISSSRLIIVDKLHTVRTY